jgi:hypothetical protein
MTLTHAVVSISHESAQIIEFDDSQTTVSRLRAHEHPTGQHHSGVRAEHEFFGRVCDAFAAMGEVLVTGTRTAIADFEHYVRKHRPAAVAQILAFEVVDHPSPKQLVALAREFFNRVGFDAEPRAAVRRH